MIETMQVDNLDFIGNPRSSLLLVRGTLLPKRSRVNVLRATCQRFLDDLAIRLIRRDLRPSIPTFSGGRSCNLHHC